MTHANVLCCNLCGASEAPGRISPSAGRTNEWMKIKDKASERRTTLTFTPLLHCSLSPPVSVVYGCFPPWVPSLCCVWSRTSRPVVVLTNTNTCLFVLYVTGCTSKFLPPPQVDLPDQTTSRLKCQMAKERETTDNGLPVGWTKIPLQEKKKNLTARVTNGASGLDGLMEKKKKKSKCENPKPWLVKIDEWINNISSLIKLWMCSEIIHFAQFQHDDVLYHKCYKIGIGILWNHWEGRLYLTALST